MLVVAMQQAATIAKPQESFSAPPDNSNTPFVPYWSLDPEVWSTPDELKSSRPLSVIVPALSRKVCNDMQACLW